MKIAFGVLWIFGGFLTAQIAQRIIVPILVAIIGERRFASPSAFDGCTLGIAGGFTGVLVPAIFMARRGPLYGLSPLWTFPLIGVGITLYSLIWLWFLGNGAKSREWRIENERILNRNNEELKPTFVGERSDYHQTDAFNGYSHYFLELHDNEQLLATNGYTSRAEFERDLAQVRHLTNARRLDLIWLWRETPTRWIYARFPREWAPVLCGALDRLDTEDRNWWHSWTFPNFQPKVASSVDTEDAKKRLERLRAAYAEFGTSDEEPQFMRAKGQSWRDINFDIDRVLATEGPVVALDDATFEHWVRQAIPDLSRRPQILHDLDGYAKIS